MHTFAKYPAETVLVPERTARTTGTRVMLVYHYEADHDNPYETICVTHGGVCSHERRQDANWFLSHPEEWCEDCMYGEGTLSGERPVERVMGSDAARAVGRFNEDGPDGYRAATAPDAPLRATRDEAVEDERAWLERR